MNRYTLLLLVVLAIFSCQTVAATDPAYIIPTAGSVVKLKRSLVVEGGRVKVYLQRGEVVRRWDLDHYYPSCNFELFKLRQRPTTIRPGSFSVVRTVRDIDYMVQSDMPQRAVLNHVSSDGGGLSMIIHVVHMYIKLSRQPNVYKLTCRSWQAHPHEAKEPNIADMREALGNVASIRLHRR